MAVMRCALHRQGEGRTIVGSGIAFVGTAVLLLGTVNLMLPLVGETGSGWWEAVSHCRR